MNKDLKAFALIPDIFIDKILMGGLLHISASADQLSQKMIMTKQSTFPRAPSTVSQPGHTVVALNVCFFSFALALQTQYS